MPFGLPLLYTQPLTGSITNQLLRASLVAIVGIISLVILVTNRTVANMRLKPLVALVIIMILSLTMSSDMVRSFFGRHGDSQGLLLQLSSLPIAILASTQIHKRSYWQKVSVVMQVVCLLSFVVDFQFTRNGYRLSGFLLHATGMGVYAVMTLGITLLLAFMKQRRAPVNQWLMICLLTLVVIACASRLAMLLVVMLMALYAICLPLIRKQLVVFSVIFIGLFCLSCLLLPATKRVDNPHKIEDGISYRFVLYKWSLQHSPLSLVGSGSADIANRLQPRTKDNVPEQLHDTFFVGYPLWYSHSQWIDVLIAYGALGLGLFVFLYSSTFVKLLRALRRANTNKRLVLLMFATVCVGMLLNFSTDTPNVEFWMLVWLVACFGLQNSLSSHSVQDK